MNDCLPPVPPRPTSDGGIVFEGISYSLPQGYRPLLLDLHLPAGARDIPVVIWIHGGAFFSGDRRYLPPTLEPGSLFEALTNAGLAVATIDYRLSAEAHFPAQLDDVTAAIRYLRKYAATLRLDAERIGLWGESAGGTLAALAGLAGLTQGAASAVVAWYPVTEMTTLDPDRTDTPEALLLGGAPAALPDLAAQASPMAQVSAAAPPFLLVHGLNDTAVPFAHSERLHQRLTEAGVSSTCLPVAGADHCFAGYTDIPGLIRESVAFLSRELGR